MVGHCPQVHEGIVKAALGVVTVHEKVVFIFAAFRRSWFDVEKIDIVPLIKYSTISFYFILFIAEYSNLYSQNLPFHY